MSASASNSGHGATRSGRSASASSGDASSSRRHPSAAMRGHRVREAERRLARERRRAEERVAVARPATGRRRRASPTSPRAAAARWSRNRRCWSAVDRSRRPPGTSHSPTSRMQHRAVAALAGRAHGGVVDARRGRGRTRPTPRPARGTQPTSPVWRMIQSSRWSTCFSTYGCAVDHDALEARSRLRVVEGHRRAARRAGDERRRPRRRPAGAYVVTLIGRRRHPSRRRTGRGRRSPAAAPDRTRRRCRPARRPSTMPAPPCTITVTASNCAPGLAARLTAAHVGSDAASRHVATSALCAAPPTAASIATRMGRCRHRTVLADRSCSSAAAVVVVGAARSCSRARWSWAPRSWCVALDVVAARVADSAIGVVVADGAGHEHGGDHEHRGDDRR